MVIGSKLGSQATKLGSPILLLDESRTLDDLGMQSLSETNNDSGIVPIIVIGNVQIAVVTDSLLPPGTMKAFESLGHHSMQITEHHVHRIELM